jgi:hypothetical protein
MPYQERVLGGTGLQGAKNRMGEAKSGAGRFDFDGHLRFCFRGAKVTTDAGLLQ